jgi:steroid 5-alpha reductase family enzyme
MCTIDDWLIYSFFFTVFYQSIFFVITYTYRFDKVTDLAGTSNFLLLAIMGFLLGGTFFERQFVLTMLVSLWAARLGSFLFLRVFIRKKDARFDKIRDSIPKLAVFWTLQAIWVWVTSIPLTFVNMSSLDVPVTLMDHVGWGMWIAGFLCEGIADFQRHRFTQRVSDPRGKPFLDTGLWRYSRHPNYFGEFLLWSGLWISAANGLWPIHPIRAIISILSPVTTFTLLVFVSGIPLAEARDDRRNHRLMAYKQYKFCTSPLFPVPKPWYASLPIWIKRWLFFDRYQLAFITPQLSRSSSRTTRSY